MSAPTVKRFGRDRHARVALGETLYEKIRSSRVLMVGAGGIGCELLKNLVLNNFGEIEVVDLDTIDLSNLNRQFLFRREHIKQSKAAIAKESASKFNKAATINARQANIKDKTFNIGWFRSFTIVFNALDNLDARRHVNRMCLAAGVPLVESGTTGFDGQVQTIVKGITECYDCNPKPIARSFPVCTIRSTPSQPIHCVVWAKSYLFNEIFGADDEEAKDVDATENADNTDEISQLKQEARELKEIRDSIRKDTFAQLVFSKVFDKDIERLRSAEDMWKDRAPPVPLKWENEHTKATEMDATIIADQDQVTWDRKQNIAVFVDSVNRLSKRTAPQDTNGTNLKNTIELSFDKDDKDTLDFVTSAANLRSLIFGMAPKSEFEIKQMAGNIIPAIATTNATTASMCVLEAFKIFRGQLKRAKTVFLTPHNPTRVIISEPPHDPNPECVVCGVATATLKVDFSRARLSNIIEDVLRRQLGYGEEISVSSDQGLVYDPDLDDNLTRHLSDLGITDGSTAVVVDDEEGEEVAAGQFAGQKAPRVNLVLEIKTGVFPEDSAPVQTEGSITIEKRPRKPQAGLVTDIGIPNGAGTGSVALKRKYEGHDPDGITSSKKLKENDQIVTLEDLGDGAIFIDD